MRWYTYGDPLGGGPPQASFESDEERFWSKVDKSGDCWEWTAGLFTEGYGSFRYNGFMTGAHRVSYEWANGHIPDGMQIDHMCRNRKCVRPEHLRLVTQKQNIENHYGRALPNSKSGIRNVSWYPRTNRWVVHVAGKNIGYFLDIKDAEAAAIEARNATYTHNDADRT